MARRSTSRLTLAAAVTALRSDASRSEWTSLELARPERFELPTSGFVGRRSIQLNYGRLFENQRYRGWRLIVVVSLRHAFYRNRVPWLQVSRFETAGGGFEAERRGREAAFSGSPV